MAPSVDLERLLDLGVPEEVLARPLWTMEDKEGVLHAVHGRCTRENPTDHLLGERVLLGLPPEVLCDCVLTMTLEDDLWYFTDALLSTLEGLSELTDTSGPLSLRENYREAGVLLHDLEGLYHSTFLHNTHIAPMEDAVVVLTKEITTFQKDMLTALKSEKMRERLHWCYGKKRDAGVTLVVGVRGSGGNALRPAPVDAILLSWGVSTAGHLFALVPGVFRWRIEAWAQAENYQHVSHVTLGELTPEDTPEILEIARSLWKDATFSEVADALAAARRL